MRSTKYTLMFPSGRMAPIKPFGISLRWPSHQFCLNSISGKWYNKLPPIVFFLSATSTQSNNSSRPSSPKSGNFYFSCWGPHKLWYSLAPQPLLSGLPPRASSSSRSTRNRRWRVPCGECTIKASSMTGVQRSSRSPTCVRWHGSNQPWNLIRAQKRNQDNCKRL